MTTPVRIQRKRTKGFDLQATSQAINGLPCIYVGRPGPFGNPWRVVYRSGWFIDGPRVNPHQHPCGNEAGAAMVAAGIFRAHIGSSAIDISALRGHNLACWCPIISRGAYRACHADVLLSIANDIQMDEVIRENIRRAKGEAL